MKKLVFMFWDNQQAIEQDDEWNWPVFDKAITEAKRKTHPSYELTRYFLLLTGRELSTQSNIQHFSPSVFFFIPSK